MAISAGFTPDYRNDWQAAGVSEALDYGQPTGADGCPAPGWQAVLR